jgi:hypothetical protein
MNPAGDAACGGRWSRPALPQPRPKATTDKLIAKTKTWLAELKAQREEEKREAEAKQEE